MQINFKTLLLFSGIVIAMTLNACKNTPVEPLQITQLDSGWQFRQVGEDQWLQATVPGCVHTDLLANSKIKDPYLGLNENDVQWIENKDWEYKCNFAADEKLLKNEKIELFFGGLDTYADVYINDTLVISADNMFISWSVECKKLLKKGDNQLRILFYSPIKMGMKKLEKVKYIIPATNEQAPLNKRTNVFTRKAPFHYGWDWGPRLVTSGIWQPVVLKAWSKAKLNDVFLKQNEVNGTLAQYTAQFEIEATDAEDVQVTILVDDVQAANAQTEIIEGTNLINLDFEIKNPKLWWTKGLGEQNLYKVTARVTYANTILVSKDISLGVRTVKLVQTPDSIGSSFYIELNGVPVFMKGSNYIPPDVFVSNVTEKQYQKVISDAVQANMNMLRVWGGAIYEKDVFYDLCDKNGILIWHDFMFACNMQPADQKHLDNIKAEAEYNVKRLRNHACMAIWCGNNENLGAWHHWNWKKGHNHTDADSIELWQTYEKIFYDILPKAVAQYDSSKFYWPSSPSSTYYNTANRKSGDEHDWSIWFGQALFTQYEKDMPRFVSEYGMQAMPEMATIRSFADEKDFDIRSEVLHKRQRSAINWIAPDYNGNDMIEWYVNQYYKKPKDFESFVYVSQLMQALGLKTAIEAHRRNMPNCMGSLYWQIDDCWPTISWASVDWYGRWKASHYAIKNAFATFMISPVIENGKVNVYLVSDSLKPVNAKLTTTLFDFQGKRLWQKDSAIIVKPNTSMLSISESESVILRNQNKQKVVLKVELRIEDIQVASNYLYFAPLKNLALEKPGLKYSTTKTEYGFKINITTEKLVKNAYIYTRNIEGKFSNNYFDIIPGETVVVDFYSSKPVDNPENEISIISLMDTYK